MVGQNFLSINTLVKDWCPYLNPFDNINDKIIEKFAKGNLLDLPCASIAEKCQNACLASIGKSEQGTIMIVSQAPTKFEDEKGIIFNGEAGNFFNEILKELNIDKNNLYFTYTIKCFIDENYISSQILKVCSYAILRREILNIKPLIIICLGRIAFQGVQLALLGKIVEDFDRGKVLELKTENGYSIKVCATYHPSYILKNIHLKPQFIKDINQFIQNNKYEINYTVLTKYDQVKQLVDNLINQDNDEILLSIDLETNSIDIHNENLKILCIGIANSWKYGFIIPIYKFHNLKNQFVSIFLEQELNLVKEDLKRLLLNSKVKIIGHNLKFDLMILEKFLQCDLIDKVKSDTMVMHYLLHEEPPHDLKSLAIMYTPFITYFKEIKELFQKNKKGWYKEINYDDLYKYCAYDICVTYYLYEEFLERINKLANQQKQISNQLKSYLDKFIKIGQLFQCHNYTFIQLDKLYQYSIQLYKVLYQAEKIGVPVSISYLQKIDKIISEQIQQLENQLNQYSGQPINWKSSVQVRNVFQKLNIESPIITPKGNPSYNEEALNILAENGNELAKLLVDYRSLIKNYTSYIKIVDNYSHKIINSNEDIMRFQCNLRLVGTETGRIIVNDPPFQTLPRDNLYRNMITAEKGWLICSADYSMADLRCIAGYANCQNMIKAFNQGVDFHRLTASQIFDKKLENVTNEERSIAKTINFGIVYLMTAKTLAKKLKITEKLAQKYIDKWFEDKLEIKKFINLLISIYDKTPNGKEVIYMNVFGRMRRIQKVPKTDKNYFHNISSIVNFYPQSTVADTLNIGTLRLIKKLQEQNLLNYCKILFPIHDALLLEIKEEYQNDIIPIIKESLEFPIPFPQITFKLPVEITINSNWSK